MKMNLQIDQFKFKDKRNELTNRAVQFKVEANAVKDELIHKLVHLCSDKINIDELTHRSVHLTLFACSSLLRGDDMQKKDTKIPSKRAFILAPVNSTVQTHWDTHLGVFQLL
jgi:hypothetical protein